MGVENCGKCSGFWFLGGKRGKQNADLQDLADKRR